MVERGDEIVNTATGEVIEWESPDAPTHEAIDLIHRGHDGTVAFARKRADGVMERVAGISASPPAHQRRTGSLSGFTGRLKIN